MRHQTVIRLGIVLLCAGFLPGCAPEAVSTLDDLAFTGLGKSLDAAYDAVLDLDIAKKAGENADADAFVPVGEASTVLVPIANAGSAPLVLTDAVIYRQIASTDAEGNRTITGTQANQTVFTFAGGVKLDYPVTVAAESTFNGLYVTFTPDTCGLQTGVVAIESEVGTRYVLLTGTGAWKLTLSVNAAQEGKITAPVEVLSASGTTINSAVYHTTSSTVAVAAQTTSSLGLSSLLQWSVINGTAAVADPLALSTRITVGSHAEVRAEFWQPYYYVDASATGTPVDGTTTARAWRDLKTAVDWYNNNISDTVRTTSTRKGIVAAAGTYAVTDNMTLIKGELKGGYNSGFTARAYETPANRADPAYATVVSLSPSVQIYDKSSMDVNSVLEGFTINGGADASATSGYAALRLTSTMTVRYNTVSGPSQGYAVAVVGSTPTIADCVLSVGDQTNDAVCVYVEGSSPAIRNSVITAGAGGMRSAGIFLYKNASPAISGNTITSGSPSATGASSMGIYIDANFTAAAPAISSNTIQAGSSSGSGCSSYGVYAINQAKKMTIQGNTISGGYGAVMAAALFFNYNSGYATVKENELKTDGGGSRYGMYLSRGVSAGGFKSPGCVHLNRFKKGSVYVHYFARGIATSLDGMEDVNELFFNDQDIADSTLLNAEID